MVRWLGSIALLAVLAATASAEPSTLRYERRRSRVHAALALGGLGGASLATGVVMGFVANAHYHKPFETGDCLQPPNQPRTCDAAGYAATEDARTLGRIGTAFGLVGVGLIAASAVVYFTAPRDAVLVIPIADRNQAGLGIVARF